MIMYIMLLQTYTAGASASSFFAPSVGSAAWAVAIVGKASAMMIFDETDISLTGRSSQMKPKVGETDGRLD